VRPTRWRASIVLATSTLAHAASALDGGPYAHRRPIEASPGFAELRLPDDVLDACRAGLADLRIATSDGQEVPYAIGAIAETRLRWPVRDVERSPGVETTAIVDRGANPVDIDAVTLLIEPGNYLKPTIVEASDDRAHWKQLAHASVFATSEPEHAAMTRIAFATSGRRYLRLRLDDKNGDPVNIAAVLGHAAASGRAAAQGPQEMRGTVTPAVDAAPGASTYTFGLPAAHLGIVALRVETASPAFARDVRVYDRVVYRGEVSRRLVGAAHLLRGAAGPDETVVALAGPTGRTLEVEIAHAAGQPLASVGFVALVTPTAIVFHAASPSGLFLYYGSPLARRPAYDLAEALAKGPPHALAQATIGPESPLSPDGGAGTAATTSDATSLVAHFAATIDRAAWRARRPIVLPPAGSVAFIAVDDRADLVPSLRIVDGAYRQVPYLVEREPRLRMAPLTFAEEKPGGATNGGTSSLVLTGIDPSWAVDAIEIDAKEPFFDREVWIEEASPRRRDRPELAGEPRRRLGAARWVRMPDQTGPLRVEIVRPEESALWISFRNGAERPLTIDRVAAERVERRLDFLFSPGEQLSLLSDNPSAQSPAYDLALIADRIAELPAESASLAPAVTVAASEEKPGLRWLWAAVFVAAIGIVAMLGRTLRSSVPPQGDPPAP
jgi:hypothetical protein